MAEFPEKKEKKPANVTADITAAVVALLLGVALFGAFINEILGWYNSLVESFYSVGSSKIKNWVMIIFLPLDLLLMTFVIFALRRYAALTRIKPESTKPQEEEVVSPREEVNLHWEHVRKLANSDSPSDWNMAILRADALLDQMLVTLGYQGESMADRLKVIDPTQLPSAERVWAAHRLRNTIVHGPTEDYSKETIIHALRTYEQALKELGVMEVFNHSSSASSFTSELVDKSKN